MTYHGNKEKESDQEEGRQEGDQEEGRQEDRQAPRLIGTTRSYKSPAQRGFCFARMLCRDGNRARDDASVSSEIRMDGIR